MHRVPIVRVIMNDAGSTALQPEKPDDVKRWPTSEQWLASAAGLPGKALHLAIAICCRVGRMNSTVVELDGELLERFSVSRHATYRALTALEDAGLVEVTRHRHKRPTIRLVQQHRPDLSDRQLKCNE